MLARVRSNILIYGGVAVGSAIFVALLIYLTPLKHFNLVEPTIRDLSPRQFYEMYEGNESEYIFIDVRSSSAYEEMHAEGSINIPLHVLYDERHNLPKTGKTIVLICGGNRSAGVAYAYLEHYGFQNLYRVRDGMPAWHLEGLPVISNF